MNEQKNKNRRMKHGNSREQKVSMQGTRHLGLRKGKVLMKHESTWNTRHLRHEVYKARDQVWQLVRRARGHARHETREAREHTGHDAHGARTHKVLIST